MDINSIDLLFEDAARLIVQNQIGSTSLIQRRMKLGYNRAGRLMDTLEKYGIVGPNQGSKAREVLIKTENDLVNHFAKLKINIPISKHINLEQFFIEYKNEIEERESVLYKEQEDKRIQEEKNDIKNELLENERKKKLEKLVLDELIQEGLISNAFQNESRRECIPQEIMDSVWNRDGGKCVKCGGQDNLEFDHIIPFSKGGANTDRNLQILCNKCYVEKSSRIRY